MSWSAHYFTFISFFPPFHSQAFRCRTGLWVTWVIVNGPIETSGVIFCLCRYAITVWYFDADERARAKEKYLTGKPSSRQTDTLGPGHPLEGAMGLHPGCDDLEPSVNLGGSNGCTLEMGTDSTENRNRTSRVLFRLGAGIRM